MSRPEHTCRECGEKVLEITRPTELGAWPIGIGLCRCDNSIWELWCGSYRDVYAPATRDAVLEMADRCGYEVPYPEV